MKFTSLNQALAYLEEFIKPTVFQKITEEKAAKKDPLDRMRTLLSLLGNPQEQFKSIQVSGTSGKGSTAYYISHILHLSGFKTGFSFSPHLDKVTERIQINEVPIQDTEFIDLVYSLVPAIEDMKRMETGEPSYFEILMAMAYCYFAQKKVDIAVIEVGIEGKYDASNTLNPLIGVITNIDLDHTEFLGETIEEIAKEAGSIVKKQNPEKNQIIVTGAKQKSVVHIIENQCRKENAILSRVNKDFQSVLKQETTQGTVFDFVSGKTEFKNLQLAMVGRYQAENAAVAIETVLQLKTFGFFVPEQSIRQALKTAIFPGRFELIHQESFSKEFQISILRLYSGQDFKFQIILDGAHNPAKMKAFTESLERLYPNTQKHFIVAFKHNKDVSGMLTEILKVADSVTATEFHVSMGYVTQLAMPATSIMNQVESIKNKKDMSVFSEEDPRRALKKVISSFPENNKENIIVVTGSLYLVGEVRGLLK